MCDKGEMASPPSQGVVTVAVMLLPAVAVAMGRPSWSFMPVQGGSDTSPWSAATVALSPCSRVVGGPVKVSTTGGLGCPSVLDAVLEGSHACVD